MRHDVAMEQSSVQTVAYIPSPLALVCVCVVCVCGGGGGGGEDGRGGGDGRAQYTLFAYVQTVSEQEV